MIAEGSGGDWLGHGRAIPTGTIMISIVNCNPDSYHLNSASSEYA